MHEIEMAGAINRYQQQQEKKGERHPSDQTRNRHISQGDCCVQVVDNQRQSTIVTGFHPNTSMTEQRCPSEALSHQRPTDLAKH